MSDTFADCPICDCCDCSPCECIGSPYDIDLTINPSDLPCGPCATGAIAIAGSKTVAPCANTTALGGPNCKNDYSDSGRVEFRITNNTNRCLRIPFFFDIAGIVNTGTCTFVGEFSCDGSPFNYGGNGVFVSWFFVCISPNSTFTGCMNHRINGCADPCCFEDSVTIGNWKYGIRCIDEVSCTTTLGCEDFGFPSGCPECCECCCISDDCLLPFSGSAPCLNGEFTYTDNCLDNCSGVECIDLGGGDFECPTSPCPAFIGVTGSDCAGSCDGTVTLVFEEYQ